MTTVVWSAKYEVFGEAAVDEGATVTNNLRFPGQYEDLEMGLYYNYYRYYNFQIGRYLTLDPKGLSGGINLFDYVDNNPINWIDPEGTIKWKGSSAQVSAIAFIGATFNRFQLTSDCIDGKSATIIVWAVGPSIGVGSKGSFSYSSVNFEDFADRIEPSRFDGIYLHAQAGITFHPGVPIRPPGQTILPGPGLGIGVGLSSIRLGDAFSEPIPSIGLSIGYDKSISGTVGTSTVMDIKHYECCE